MKKSVLIIDDSGTSLLLMEWILQNEGYITQIAESVTDGIALLKDHKPDLILLDLILPKMHGFEVLKSIKEDPAIKDIPVIVLTNLEWSAGSHPQTLARDVADICLDMA